jgi:hypothetical protein
MKRLLVLAAAASLLLPTLSLAQPGQGGRPDRPGNGGPPSGGGKPGGPSTLPARPPGGGPNRPGPGKPNPGGPNRPSPGKPNPGRPNPGGPNRPGPGKPPPRPTPPSVRPPPRPGPGMRPPPRPQFSWRGRRYNPVRGPAFRYPSGYAYRRWSVGALLPSLFLSSLYYYDDWRTLGIGAPPAGRRWVRYGSDLLLVNTRTRQVEDVIPDVFY